MAAAAFAADIKARGMRPAVALAVGTSIDAVLPLLQSGAVDMVLCMTVECGFGGQKFQEQVLTKVGVRGQRAPWQDGNLYTTVSASVLCRLGRDTEEAESAQLKAPDSLWHSFNQQQADVVTTVVTTSPALETDS